MLLRLAVILAFACQVVPAGAQSLQRDDFEGPEPSLREAGGDASYKVDVHERTQQGAHSGRWCERLKLTGNNGTAVYFSRAVGAIRVIQELAPSVWLKADRPGLQMMVRVVLPRSYDPQSGKPLTALVRGADYRQVGAWQQLRVDNIPRLLERQVRLLRTQYGPQVDAREAYVDLILLNVYGGPGVTNVWVDDLEVAGAVSSPAAGSASPSNGPVAGPTLSSPAIAGPAQTSQTAPSNWPGGRGAPRAELKGRLLLVADKPFFPRIIEWRGEPFSRLQALGFNALRLSQTPTPEQLREAAGLGLWLVAPPPAARELEGRAGTSGAKIGPAFDPILVWDLGVGLTQRDLAATKRWAESVRNADPRGRPLVCDADSDLHAYTRLTDLLLAHREPLGSTLSLEQYGNWLRERTRLARGGTPLWATIQTEPAPRLVEQIRLASAGQIPPVGLLESQIRTLVHTALAARARGLCFTSSSRLDFPDIATQRRSAILESINLQLDLIERWPAAGNFAPSASSNDPHTTGAVIESDRSRLLLPIFLPPSAQLAAGNPKTKDLSFTVVGVPEGDDAYELSPTAMRPLPSLRIAGGTFVTLRDAERDSVVVFTQDPIVHGALQARLEKNRLRAAQVARDVAQAEMAQVDAIEQRLAGVGQSLPIAQKLRATAQNDLQQCDAAFKADGLKPDTSKAYYSARHAQQALRDLERAYWDKAIPSAALPVADPFAGSFATLPEHYRLVHELSTAARGPNGLSEGGFEDLNAMRRAGWEYFQHDTKNDPTGITTAVDLAPEAAHSGHLGLRLRAVPADPENKPSVVESPPLWITSAPVPVQPGDLLHIQGWLRIAQPIVGSVDGLLVIDSLSGESLAQRITTAGDWRQFTIYRAAGYAGPMTVTFALTGLGEVWIDDVTIQVVQRAPRQQPGLPQQQASTPVPPNSRP